MRVGVISDTHNHLPNVARIVELLNAARIDAVVHTGDITRAATLEALSRIRAPLVAVLGNNDERDGLCEVAPHLGARVAEGPLELAWAGRRIVVVHDPRDLDWARRPEHELALHGHDHRYRLERSDGCTIFNPGESAGHLPGRSAVGVVDLETLAVELLHF